MKSRLFHHKDPRAASRTGAQSDTDTLSMLSVGAVTLTPEGEIVFNEVNTIPGFTAHSRYPNMMKAAGLDFTTLITCIIEEVGV